MALYSLKSFNNVDKRFEPLDNADTSEEHARFEAGEVERTFLRSQRCVDEFTNNARRFGNTISTITSTGLRGRSISIAISNYRSKVNSSISRINEMKRTYTRTVTDKINRVSTGEKSSSKVIDSIGSIGSINSTNDVTMQEANDIINWAKNDGALNNVPNQRVSNNQVEYNGLSLNSWFNESK